jgi:hypothetical protein
MPPRRSARVTAATELATSALSPLPLSVVHHIFSLLPVDCRLRCAEVCRGWRSVLLERSLWTRLELTTESGVRVPRGWGSWHWNALLRCAAARAGRALQSLRVEPQLVTLEALLVVVAANAGTLRELHAISNAQQLDGGCRPQHAHALLVEAPLLRTFVADLSCNNEADVQAARHALRNEAPFGRLRVRRLHARFCRQDEAGIVALAADVAAHASLEGLSLHNAWLNTAAAEDAVVDAALARRLQSVRLDMCTLSPTCAPALLSSDALTTLQLTRMPTMDAPTMRALAAALRANATLTSLELWRADAWRDAEAEAELLGALTGHASLRVLCLRANGADAGHEAAVGATLASLVAANTRALTSLHVSFCILGDDGLRPLLEALPRNTHLRTLNCTYNGTSAAFARDVALPALRANTGLRQLESSHDDIDADVAADIARELRSRAQ